MDMLVRCRLWYGKVTTFVFYRDVSGWGGGGERVGDSIPMAWAIFL